MATIKGSSGKDFIHKAGDGLTAPKGYKNKLGVTSKDDILSGLGGNDMLFGNNGNDVLDGGKGADRMNGGRGNDTYVVDNAKDRVIERAKGGIDLVQAALTYTLGKEIENLALTGTVAINGTGNALANILTGNSAANLLFGRDGDDTLDGGAGGDTLDGGAGNDIFLVDDAGDMVTEAAGGGDDLVKSSVTYTLGAEIERLELTGTAAINGTGNGLANTITGNSAANVLDGGAGADKMAGGAGDDGYIVDDVGDVIIEGQNGGTDTVEASVDTTLANDVENLNLVGAATIGTGNALDNAISGNSLLNSKLYGLAGNDTIEAGEGGDELYGGEGADVLNGWGGQDRLDGGTGADTMAGGDANDYYLVDDASDIVIEQAGGGVKDQVSSTVSYTLSLNVETLELTGSADIKATGNSQNNTLRGNSGNNELDGGAGGDKMDGLAGNDTYVVDDLGDVVTEAVAGGNDTVKASISHVLSLNVENLELTGTADLNGTGNIHANNILGNSGANTLSGLDGSDIINGGDGDDVLTGGNGDDQLYGGNGNDQLDGDAGSDKLFGGLGNDIYTLDDTNDAITEMPGGGHDSVSAAVNFVLPDNVEDLTLFSTATSGTDNVLANKLIGNDSFASQLKGMEGADLLIGQSASDFLSGGLDGDTLTGNGGSDSFVFEHAEAGAFDIVEDFTAGQDILVFTMSGLSIGDGDTVVDSFTATSLNWSGAQEVVFYTAAVNNLNASTVAAIMPNAIAAVTAGNRQLIAVHNGTDAAIFLFVSDGDADVETGELTKIAELDKITSLGASDFLFFS